MYLIPRLLRHAQITKAQGTLIVPQWVSVPFWPVLFPDGINPAQFIKESRMLPMKEPLFMTGPLGANLFKGTPNTPVLAMRLCFADEVNAGLAVD